MQRLEEIKYLLESVVKRTYWKPNVICHSDLGCKTTERAQIIKTDKANSKWNTQERLLKILSAKFNEINLTPLLISALFIGNILYSM